jgi:hypothetical protein
MNEWSPSLIRQQIVQCFTTDPDDDEVRAVVVLHQDLDLLPKDTLKRAADEATASGEPFEGVPAYMAFAFGFDDEDRVEIFMGGNLTVVLRESAGFHSPQEAARYAAGWVGEGGRIMPFENIPGLYQSALMEFITDREYDIGPLIFAWTLPAAGAYVPVRQFPPKISDGDEPD